MTANDCYRPSIDAQLRYTVQWFHEWSEMQRGDFLPILTQKFAPANYINGLISGMDSLGCVDGRPPSLFQCRVKLFREWVDSWSQTERDQLLGHIKNMDPGFHARLEEELGSSNGEVARSEDSPCDERVEPSVETAAEEEAVPPQQVSPPQQALPDVVAPIVNSNLSVHDDSNENDEPEPQVELKSVEPEADEEVVEMADTPE